MRLFDVNIWTNISVFYISSFNHNQMTSSFEILLVATVVFLSSLYQGYLSTISFLPKCSLFQIFHIILPEVMDGAEFEISFWPRTNDRRPSGYETAAGSKSDDSTELTQLFRFHFFVSTWQKRKIPDSERKKELAWPRSLLTEIVEEISRLLIPMANKRKWLKNGMLLKWSYEPGNFFVLNDAFVIIDLDTVTVCVDDVNATLIPIGPSLGWPVNRHKHTHARVIAIEKRIPLKLASKWLYIYPMH